MPALESITIKGFKSIHCVEDLRLGAINVLIGANGSGKSNFIDALAFLQTIQAGNLQYYVARAGGADELLHFGSRVTEQMTIHICFDNEVNQYEITLVPTNTGTLYPYSERVSFWDKKRYPNPHDEFLTRRGGEAGISDRFVRGAGHYVRMHLDRWRLYHFHDTSAESPMKKTADLNDNPYLRPDGSNLAAFLYRLREEYEDSYRLIQKTMQLVTPFFDDFALEPQALNEDKIRLEWTHMGTDAYFDASSFSDGTLRFIALTTLLFQPERLRPSVILLDEPELGLHPYAITRLASLIKSASVKTQIILATQSPILLDHFEPNDVLVADRVNDATELSRLDADRLEKWLERYSLGELWEKNEIGGRPGGEATVQAQNL